ncbi:MAG: hypothetical protein ACOCWG_03690 [bacterium]
MEKKRVIVDYKKLSPEVQKMMVEQYPYGYNNDIIKVNKGDNKHFYAVIVETEEFKYLVKVDVKVDLLLDEPDKEKKSYTRKKRDEAEVEPELEGEINSGEDDDSMNEDSFIDENNYEETDD